MRGSGFEKAHLSSLSANRDCARMDALSAGQQIAQLVTGNLDDGMLPLADEYADVVASIETIEHLENPRAFMRQLARVVKPGGVVVGTTPNQLSLWSKMTLGLKNQFNAFQEGFLTQPI